MALRIYAALLAILLTLLLALGLASMWDEAWPVDFIIGAMAPGVAILGAIGMWRLRWWGVVVLVVWSLALLVVVVQSRSPAWTIVAFIIVMIVLPLGLSLLYRRQLR